jgi:ABC-2 type transport system permease protein
VGRLRRLVRTVKVTGALLRAALRAELQYRANLFVVCVGLVYQGSGFAFIWVVLDRFETIAGWSTAEVAFLYGLRLTAHGLWVVPFNRLLELDITVRQGEFDRYLIRPLHPLLQLLTSRFWLGSFGDIIGGVTILGVALTLVDVHWSPVTVVYLLLALVGGALVESAVQLLISSFTFRILSTRPLQVATDTVFNTFGNYPLSIFRGAWQWLMTFVLPLAFVAYLPASLLLDHTGGLAVPAELAYVTFPVGVVWFGVAWWVWDRQARHYQSTGH